MIQIPVKLSTEDWLHIPLLWTVARMPYEFAFMIYLSSFIFFFAIFWCFLSEGTTVVLMYYQVLLKRKGGGGGWHSAVLFLVPCVVSRLKSIKGKYREKSAGAMVVSRDVSDREIALFCFVLFFVVCICFRLF